MKRMIFLILALATALPAMAAKVSDDGSLVLLPVEAQTCNLPSAPPPIPEEPVYDDLISAQKKVKAFQTGMEIYRACINHDVLSDELSEGNRQAITNAHNYSVGMEERVAEMFNVAVRAYKKNKAKN